MHPEYMTSCGSDVELDCVIHVTSWLTYSWQQFMAPGRNPQRRFMTLDRSVQLQRRSLSRYQKCSSGQAFSLLSTFESGGGECQRQVRCQQTCCQGIDQASRQCPQNNNDEIQLGFWSSVY